MWDRIEVGMASHEQVDDIKHLLPGTRFLVLLLIYNYVIQKSSLLGCDGTGVGER